MASKPSGSASSGGGNLGSGPRRKNGMQAFASSPWTRRGRVRPAPAPGSVRPRPIGPQDLDLVRGSEIVDVPRDELLDRVRVFLRAGMLDGVDRGERGDASDHRP